VYPLPKDVQIVAHRGFKADYPENTLAAFQAAADCGAPMIEFDVHLSADDQLVIIHDDTLNRTTTGKGAVLNHSLADLRVLDAGAWFSPQFAGEKIPTLETVVRTLKSRLAFNIEIKADPKANQGQRRMLAEGVSRLIADQKIAAQTVVSSFDWDLLAQVQGASLGLLSDRPATAADLATCRKLDAFSWHQKHSSLTEAQVTLLHEHNLAVFVYTVNAPKIMQTMRRIGVNGIITDDPALGLRQMAIPPS